MTNYFQPKVDPPLADIRIIKLTLLAVVVLELLSFVAYRFPLSHTYLFVLAVLFTIALFAKKLEYGFYFLLLELFIGSKGYLLALTLPSGDRISLRFAIFVIAIIFYLITLIKGKGKEFFTENKWLGPYLALAFFVAIGITNGWLLSSSKSFWFFDLNSWLFFLAAPIFFTCLKSKDSLKNIVSILLASSLYLSLKTLFILSFFGATTTPLAGFVYYWIRNTGVGEITFLKENLYRVFFQSQLFLLPALLISGAFMKQAPTKKQCLPWFGYLIIISSALLASLSRSFWLGIIVIIILALFLPRHAGAVAVNGVINKFNVAQAGKFVGKLCVVFVMSLILLSLLTLNFWPKVLYGRLENQTEEAAGASRINQLQPLLKRIAERPILGSGFGADFTYKTSDPRALAENPTGLRTTYASEWGFLDIALKIGILGLLAYLWINIKILISTPTRGQIWALKCLILAGLLTVNIFSPYLNHPLGICWILLLSFTEES